MEAKKMETKYLQWFYVRGEFDRKSHTDRKEKICQTCHSWKITFFLFVFLRPHHRKQHFHHCTCFYCLYPKCHFICFNVIAERGNETRNDEKNVIAISRVSESLSGLEDGKYFYIALVHCKVNLYIFEQPKSNGNKKRLERLWMEVVNLIEKKRSGLCALQSGAVWRCNESVPNCKWKEHEMQKLCAAGNSRRPSETESDK